jgi:hypothetical protein
MTLNMRWNLKWLRSKWCDSMSDNATTCHRICMSAWQWAQPESRRCVRVILMKVRAHTAKLTLARGDARSSWCITNNYRVQLGSSKHRTSTNTSNTEEIIGLHVSPCRGTTSNAMAALRSQPKQTWSRNYVEHTTNINKRNTWHTNWYIGLGNHLVPRWRR